MKKIAFIETFCLLCVVVLHSQPKTGMHNSSLASLIAEKDNYQTKIYGTQSGLPDSEITSLAQDNNGFLWVGTNAGLSRYDGRLFKNFLKAGNHPTGRIYSIREDTLRKVVWIACKVGLCYFKDEKLFLPKFNSSGFTVYDTYIQTNGDIWYGTPKGPVFIPSKKADHILTDSTILFYTFLLPQWKAIHQSDSKVHSITGNGSGGVYFAGDRSLYFYSGNTLKKIWFDDNKQSGLSRAIKLTRGNGDTVFFTSASGRLFNVVKNKVASIADGNSPVTALTVHQKQLYYTTDKAIFKWNLSTGGFTKLDDLPDSGGGSISCLLVDNENNLWAGMRENLMYRKPRFFYTYKSEPGKHLPEFYSAYQLKNGHLILGGNKGNLYIKSGSSFKDYYHENSRSIPLTKIKAIYQDSRGWLWLGSSDEGIVILKNKELIHFTKANNGLSNNNNCFFYEDAARNIYTGGNDGFSRVSYDSTTGKFLIKNFFFRAPEENIEAFRNCTGGPDNSVWFGGYAGLLCFKENQLSKYEIPGINMPNITDIKPDHLGNIWIATIGEGLWQCFFDNNGLLQVKKTLSEKDGLQSDIYLNLAIDNRNTVWAAGYRGVTGIQQDGSNLSITNYSSADGFLSSNYRTVQLFPDTGDTMWVVTPGGLTSFYTGNTAAHKKIILSITGVIVLGDGHKGASDSSNRFRPGIKLPYNLNGIEFQYKAICLSDARRIRYSYRMIGLKDTTWLDWVDKEVAIYQNLPPGKYSFQVKALLNNNVPSNLVTIPFIISKPFWVLWWFILIAIFTFLSAIYTIIKRWKKRVQYQNEEKIKTQKLISAHLQYRLEVEEVTNYFNQLMSATETEDELLWDVARQCISKLNFEDCVIYLKDESANILVQKAAWGPKMVMSDSGELPKQIILSPIEIPVGKGIVGSVAKTGVAEIIPDVTKDSRYILDDAQRCSEITVPIIYDNKVLGIIDSESSHFNYYTQWHLQILADIALHCAERIVKLRADKVLENNKRQLLETRQKLAEERLTALRSQMNPHFIFNSLNSIQQFVLTGDVESANKYLSHFSKLIRLVLQYSEANFITLEEEIGMLQLYLSLEKTRFGDTFEYNIHIEENIDTDEIKIPNLMVQPFVENAIWHGLMYKEGRRKIEIYFRLSEDKCLVCEVLDNGIGRKKYEELKSLKPTDQKRQSKGIQLIKDKGELLRQQFGKEVYITINDIVDDTNKVSGTRVLIKLPLTE